VLSCRQLVERVTDYLEHAVDDVIRDEIDEHLSDCPGCRLYLAQMQTVVRALGDLGEQNLDRRRD
jgi:predicted anti-sigma-YlaC factor YlaD